MSSSEHRISLIKPCCTFFLSFHLMSLMSFHLMSFFHLKMAAEWRHVFVPCGCLVYPDQKDPSFRLMISDASPFPLSVLKWSYHYFMVHNDKKESMETRIFTIERLKYNHDLLVIVRSLHSLNRFTCSVPLHVDGSREVDVSHVWKVWHAFWSLEKCDRKCRGVNIFTGYSICLYYWRSS